MKSSKKMNKIKVLQVVGSMKNGGVESFVLSYFRELHDVCEFTFLCFDDSTAIPYEEIESLGGKVVVVPHVKKLIKFNKAFDKLLKENHYDIIHSNVNTLSVFVLRIAKKNNCPVRIAHAHSSSNKKEVVRHLIKSILKNFSKKDANVYFACGEEAGRYQFGNKAYDEGKVILINNCIDVSRFKYSKENREQVRKELSLSNDDIVVGTVGRMVSVKNHFFILELAKKNLDKKFVFVGNGELEEELKRQAKEDNLSNVIFVDSNNVIERYYSAFDVFILPSLYEGFPITTIEAQANGLYVIFSDHVTPKALITGYGEFLPIDEDNDLQKWTDVLSVKHERKDLSQMIIDARFDIKSSSKYLYKTYLKLIEEHK